MNKQSILQQTEQYVRKELSGESSGHDWWHIHRVRNLALSIAREEETDLFIVEMAALLHDIGDPKLYDDDTTIAPKLIGSKLDELGVVDPERKSIIYIIGNMSFSKSLEGKEVDKSKEFMVVQDADRLDAIGAVGIARTFAFGGNKNRLIYDPNILPNSNLTPDQYRKAEGHTINHFYEKLFLLKDRMNTDTAKKMAGERHKFMESFLEQFYGEWDGKL